jgi:hypothetical protein
VLLGIDVSRLTTADIDRRVAELRAVLDRTSASLVELDADVTRQLLDQSTVLHGATSESWRDAAARYANLWMMQFAIDNVFTQVVEERGTRRAPTPQVLAHLDQMLTGACVDAPDASEPDRPRLIDSGGETSRCSIEQALDQMRADYDVVTALLTRVAVVWGECTERLEQIETQVLDLFARVQGCGMRPTNQLRAIADEVATACTVAREDPLSFSANLPERLEERLARARVTVDETVRAEEARAVELADADKGVQACLAATRACRDEFEALAQRVVLRDASRGALDTLANDVEALRTELERARQYDLEGAAAAISRRSGSLRIELGRLAESERAWAERRDELRGLLRAYRAKADAVGLAEDLEVDAAYLETQNELYSSPCDLDAAERLLTEFRHAIRDRTVTTP